MKALCKAPDRWALFSRGFSGEKFEGMVVKPITAEELRIAEGTSGIQTS